MFFLPEFDRVGFDILLDDGYMGRRFQLKSYARSAGTAAWDIHKRLLRPTMGDAQTLGFELSPEGVGLGGGVILISIDDTIDACPVTYSYTDVFVVIALAEGLINSTNSYRCTQAAELLHKLSRGTGRERVSVPLGVFVQMRSPSALLAIGGFHSCEDSYAWWGNLLAALRGGFRAQNTPFSAELVDRTTTAHAAHSAESLISLIDDSTLSAFEPRPGAGPP
jgi:hypothetical protein